jgi:toluene monooxygenase system ferredoxin subunit
MRWRLRAAAPSPGDDLGATDPQSWVDVAGVDEFHANRLVVALDGVAVLVVRSGRNLTAMENECPHLAQPLSTGRISGRVIQCAAHGYRWDLDTGSPVLSAKGLARRPLQRFAVRVVGDRILLGRPLRTSAAR